MYYFFEIRVEMRKARPRRKPQRRLERRGSDPRRERCRNEIRASVALSIWCFECDVLSLPQSDSSIPCKFFQ